MDLKSLDLSKALEILVAGGKKQQEANRKNRGRKKVNPHKKHTVITKEDGSHSVQLVDHRLSDSKWQEEYRVLLMRQVSCQCGTVWEAPNEHMLVRKTHPRHGILEEAIQPHGSQYRNLPLTIETLHSCTSTCPQCLTALEAQGNTVSHTAQLSFDFPSLEESTTPPLPKVDADALHTADAPAEEDTAEDEFDLDINLAALEEVSSENQSDTD